ncbi:MAG TPA: RsmE family RNA methyltransferase, partial [Dehalococcoidales bacterium]
KEVVAGAKPSSILALIGPEGDFSPAEVKRAVAVGFIPVSLGETVLRVETAAIAVASFLKLEYL